MSTKRPQDLFLDYAEGRLEGEEVRRLEQSLAESPSLRREFEEYTKVLSLSRLLATPHEADARFSADVMAAIAQQRQAPGWWRGLLGFLEGSRPRPLWALSAAAALVVLILIVRAGEVPPISGPVISSGSSRPGPTGMVTYNDVRISNSVSAVLTYLEGTFSALLMLVCGMLAVLCALLRKRGWAFLFLILTIALFLLRAGLSVFFNDVAIGP